MHKDGVPQHFFKSAKEKSIHRHSKHEALKKRTGFDGNKRWGNSAVKGHGVNSPAMMEARKKFQK